MRAFDGLRRRDRRLVAAQPAVRLHAARSGRAGVRAGRGRAADRDAGERQGVRDRPDPRLGAADAAGVRLAPGDLRARTRTPRSRCASSRWATRPGSPSSTPAGTACRPTHVARHGFPNARLPDPPWRVVAGAAGVVQGRPGVARMSVAASEDVIEAARRAPPPARAPGGVRLHLRHGGDERALVRPDDPGAAEPDPLVLRRRHARRPRRRTGSSCSRVTWGVDAVRLRPGAGHAVRPLRPPAGDADLDPRPALDFLVMAFAPTLAWLLRRPGAERRDGGQLLHRQRLCRRYRRRRRTAPATSAGWRRPSASASCSARWSAAARSAAHRTFGCRSWSRRGCALLNWLYGLFVLPESLPPERRTRRVPLAPRQSGRPRCASCARHRDLLPLAGDQLPLPARPARAAQHLRALHPLPLPLVARLPGR